MNKIRLLSLWVLFFLILTTSCRKEFEDHYESKGSSTISQNIVDILREKPDFSLFVRAIDRLDLAVTLGKSGIYTCLAPRNKDVEAFLSEKNYTIETIPERELSAWVNYHFVSGMMYLYDFDKKFAVADKKGLEISARTTYRTREDALAPSKYIRFYSPAYFAERASDYKFLYEFEGSDFMVNGVKISTEERDIDAANGVIHVLESPLSVAPRADEAIAKDPELSILSKWTEKYAYYFIKPADPLTGKVDTTKVKGYDYGSNLANEEMAFTWLAPTDKAIQDFFGPYMENFDNDYQAIPDGLIISVMRTLGCTGYASGYSGNLFWGMTDITRNFPYYITDNFVYTRLANVVEPNYAGSVVSSNAAIYKVNKMLVSPVLHSVEGGVYLHQKTYGNWIKMLDKGLGVGTDILTYQHSPKTLLVQPDKYWEKRVEDYSPKYVSDTLTMILRAGMINLGVKDGKFEHRYYPTSAGNILHEDGSFYDYLGNKATIVSNGSTWDGENGSIYEVDGFLQPITALLDTLNIYSYRLLEADDYSQFTLACEMVPGLVSQLRQGGYFSYTIFAPTNEAIAAANIDISTMTPAELKQFVESHIVTAKIFTDGTLNGSTFQNLSKDIIRFAGSWGGFEVIDPSGQHIGIISGQENLQANNGVLHGIATVFKKQ